MTECSISNAKYIYLHDRKWPLQAIDVHHIIVRKSGSKRLFAVVAALLLLAYVLYCIFLLKEVSIAAPCWSFLLGALLLKSLKSVKKESVVVMPAFGVQLETYYQSGRITRRFVPISKILKPVLNECVTPVTCYWTLSLIVRDEEELMLVFKLMRFKYVIQELRPPVKMLVPIWKALCAAANSIDTTDVSVDCR